MGTLNPLKTLTCHACLQWGTQCQDTIHDNDRQAITNKDDEEEFLFQGIPIAGENEGDSDDSWDSETFEPTQNVTFALPLHPSRGIGATDSPAGSLLSKLHLKATEAIAFLVGSVKDGVVQTYTLPPIPLNPNFYQPLTEITDDPTPHTPGFTLAMDSPCLPTCAYQRTTLVPSRKDPKIRSKSPTTRTRTVDH
jgi:hypothetical protein